MKISAEQNTLSEMFEATSLMSDSEARAYDNVGDGDLSAVKAHHPSHRYIFRYGQLWCVIHRCLSAFEVVRDLHPNQDDR